MRPAVTESPEPSPLPWRRWGTKAVLSAGKWALTSARSPLGPPPPERDAEDQDGTGLARGEQQRQEPAHVPALGRGTEGRGGIRGGCIGKTIRR